MTFLEFSQLVSKHTEFEAQPSETTTPELKTAITQSLKLFCEQTYCLYRENVSVTIPMGARIVDLQAITPPVIRATQLRIDNQVLRRSDGKAGSIRPHEAAHLNKSDSGTPKRWWSISMSQIGIHPRPTGDTQAQVEGYVSHPPYVNDSDLVILPDELLRVAAAFTAARILLPRASGSSLEKMKTLDAEAAMVFEKLLQEAARFSSID